MDCFILTKDNKTYKKINFFDISKKINNFNKRDFYFFDSRIKFDISSLTIKKNCIILKFDNIKGIVFENEAYIISDLMNINSYNETYLPFHVNVIEYLFNTTIEILDFEFNDIFNYYLNKSKSLNLSFNLFDKHSNLLNLEYRVKELQIVTEDLIKNKEDLIAFTFNLIQYEDIEQMIENYNLKLDDIYNDISKLLKEIDNNHKIENLKLAKDRNKYALMNLYISFISLSFSFGSFVGSIFGMNLNNYINKNDLSFLIVTLLIVIFMLFIIKIQFHYLKYI